MKTLNLVYPDKSDIKYKISNFPDGQKQVTIINMDALQEYYMANTGAKSYYVGSVQLRSRLNNFSDLELIICAVKSLRELGVKRISLYIPYFLGSRSDRKFEEGSNNYLKDVICPIINNLNFESVTVLDPHSDVLEACLNNFKKESNKKLVEFTLNNLYGKTNGTNPLFILISPDAGANKKIYKIADEINYNGDIITCSKDRDNNGKLTKTIVPIEQLKNNWFRDRIIIDDVVDGGATFINIIRAIDDQRNDRPEGGKNYLIVTHGIFSKGLNEILQYFDGIYCTNSYKDIVLDKFLYRENHLEQINVF